MHKQKKTTATATVPYYRCIEQFDLVDLEQLLIQFNVLLDKPKKKKTRNICTRLLFFFSNEFLIKIDKLNATFRINLLLLWWLQSGNSFFFLGGGSGGDGGSDGGGGLLKVVGIQFLSKIRVIIRLVC